MNATTKCPQCHLDSIVEITARINETPITFGFWCLNCDSRWVTCKEALDSRYPGNINQWQKVK